MVFLPLAQKRNNKISCNSHAAAARVPDTGTAAPSAVTSCESAVTDEALFSPLRADPSSRPSRLGAHLSSNAARTTSRVTCPIPVGLEPRSCSLKSPFWGVLDHPSSRDWGARAPNAPPGQVRVLLLCHGALLCHELGSRLKVCHV